MKISQIALTCGGITVPIVKISKFNSQTPISKPVENEKVPV